MESSNPLIHRDLSAHDRWDIPPTRALTKGLQLSAPTRQHRSHTSRLRVVGAVLSTLVLVAGCGGEPATGEQTSTDTTTSKSSTRTTTSKSTTTTVERTPETETAATGAPAAATPAASGPTLVECVYGGGAWTETGWFSDGSYGYHPQCAALLSEQLARYPYQCPRTDQRVADLSECANSNGIPLPPEGQNAPAVEKPEETVEPVEPPADPPVEPGVGETPEADPCEAGDIAEACQE